MDTRGALANPLRRQILRALIAYDEPLAAAELMPAVTPGTSLSAASYHARVLSSAGAVGLTRTDGAADRFRPAELDRETLELLDATHEGDA